MTGQKLTTFLDNQGVKYVIIRHSAAYTAQEVAESIHLPGSAMAKTVIVSVDGRMAMAVLPASEHVSLEDLRGIVGSPNVRLADEDEFAATFPDCEVGAMPPFGNLYGLDVYCDPSLADNEQIAFNAGSHTEVVRMAWRDFERLVEPKVVAMTII